MIDISPIQNDFINDIKESKLHSIMTGEVTDEVVSICFRYVNSKKDIHVVFLEQAAFDSIMMAHLTCSQRKKCSVIYIRKNTSSSRYTLHFTQFKFSISEGCENSNH